MIADSAGVNFLVATRPVDFCKGADSFATLVREQLRMIHSPIFVFRSKRADRLKILAWDGSGLVLLWKRLEHKAFCRPPISDVMRFSASQAGTRCPAAGRQKLRRDLVSTRDL